MPNYYIDTEGITAVDPDSGGPGFPEDLTSQVAARVFKGATSLGTFRDIAPQAAGVPWNWTTPINIDSPGTYRIEYFVTDNRGDTSVLNRIVKVTDGNTVTTEAYLGIYNQVDDGMYGAGRRVAVSNDGQWASCSFHGHWEGDDFPEAHPTDLYTSFNTKLSHGAVVFNKNDPDDTYIATAKKVMGYFDAGSARVYRNTFDGKRDTIEANGVFGLVVNLCSSKIKFNFNGVWHVRDIVSINPSTNKILVSPEISEDILPDFPNTDKSYPIAIYTDAYSEPPSKDSKISDIATPDSTSPSIVPQEPIVAHSSPYTRARAPNSVSSYTPDGLVWTMRYKNNQWNIDGLFRVPFDGTQNSTDYFAFGRQIALSKDGSTLAVVRGSLNFYVYKRTSVFSHLIFMYSNSSTLPSKPSDGPDYIPSGWTDQLDNNSNESYLYVCRAKTSNNGSTYNWGNPYQVETANWKQASSDETLEDLRLFPHIGRARYGVEAGTHNEYGWSLTTSTTGINPGFIINSIALSKDGNRVTVGGDYNSSLWRETGYVVQYQYNSGTSWSQRGGTIRGPNGNTIGVAENGIRRFANRMSCDDSGNVIVVGSKGWLYENFIPMIEGEFGTTSNTVNSNTAWSGAVNCFVYNNGWRNDSLNSKYGHKDTTYNISYATQTTNSKWMYPAGAYATIFDSSDRLPYHHGIDVQMSADGNTMYVASKFSIMYPRMPTWSASETFNEGDMVEHWHTPYENSIDVISWRYEGQIFRSKINNNINNQPTLFWGDSNWEIIGETRSTEYLREILRGPTYTYRWIFGYNENSLESSSGVIFVYKKVISSSYSSGFYWHFDDIIEPPKVFGYNGWVTKGLNSLAISDNESTILMGSGSWVKHYIDGDGSYGRVAPIFLDDQMSVNNRAVFPGGWTFAQKNSTPIHSLERKTQTDNSVFDDFIAEESQNPDTIVPENYLGAPDRIDPQYGGQVIPLRSLTPNNGVERFVIIYIVHNTSQSQVVSPTSYKIYSKYYSGSDFDYIQRAFIGKDSSNIYQAQEISFNEYTPGIYVVSVKSVASSGDVSLYSDPVDLSFPGRNYNPITAITPIDVLNYRISYYPNTDYVDIYWEHDILSSNWANQSEEHHITYETNNQNESSATVVLSDYAKNFQSYKLEGLQYGTYSESFPGEEVAKIYTFYIQQKNASGFSLQKQNLGSVYTYNWSINSAPGNPIEFNTQINNGIVYIDLKIPYNGYTGGKPDSLIFYISTINAFPASYSETYTSGEIDVVFDQANNITTSGFLHNLSPNLGTINIGTTYYIWVRAVNGRGTSSWVASQRNILGGTVAN